MESRIKKSQIIDSEFLYTVGKDIAESIKTSEDYLKSDAEFGLIKSELAAVDSEIERLESTIEGLKTKRSQLTVKAMQYDKALKKLDASIGRICSNKPYSHVSIKDTGEFYENGKRCN